MSSLGKIFLVIALVGGVVAGILGFLVVGKYNDTRTNLTQTEQDRDIAKKKVAQAEKDAEVATQAKEQATSELTEAKGKVEELNTQLNAAQKQQDDLKTAVQTANDATAKAKADLDAVTATLGMSPADAKAALKKAQDEKAAAESEQKILQDQYQAAQKQVADLKDAINRSKTGDMKPGISGKVTFVNRTWNFVVLNVGLSDGVVPNGELIIYRGKNFLGKIRVTSAEANSAVADILPDAKADIQAGDDVLN